jgi:hypothetical protein
MVENLALLAPVDGVRAVELPSAGVRFEAVPGKLGSVRIFAHLAEKHGGRITQAAAREGLEVIRDLGVCVCVCVVLVLSSLSIVLHRVDLTH